MKAGDLAGAQALVGEHAAIERLRTRLADGEALRLTVGEGGTASEIVLAAGFVAQLRADLIAGLARRAEDKAAELRALGVDE